MSIPGGLPARRPDQMQFSLPGRLIAPGDPNIVRARVVIIFGTTGGLFVYSGTPAAGNLILSLAAAAGSDAFGNAYVEGIGLYSGGAPVIEARPDLSGIFVYKV